MRAWPTASWRSRTLHRRRTGQSGCGDCACGCPARSIASRPRSPDTRCWPLRHAPRNPNTLCSHSWHALLALLARFARTPGTRCAARTLLGCCKPTRPPSPPPRTPAHRLEPRGSTRHRRALEAGQMLHHTDETRSLLRGGHRAFLQRVRIRQPVVGVIATGLS